MTSPAVRELDDGLPALLEPSACAADEEGDSFVVLAGEEVKSGEFAAGAVLDSLSVGEGDEDTGPCGTGVTCVDAGSGDEESVGLAASEELVATVPLLMSCRLARLAMCMIPVAIFGSSLCMASTAVRSSGNMPCLNFFGEKS